MHWMGQAISNHWVNFHVLNRLAIMTTSRKPLTVRCWICHLLLFVILLSYSPFYTCTPLHDLCISFRILQCSRMWHRKSAWLLRLVKLMAVKEQLFGSAWPQKWFQPKLGNCLSILWFQQIAWARHRLPKHLGLGILPMTLPMHRVLGRW